MVTVRTLEPYEDENGNRIEYDGPVLTKNIRIQFVGSNNVLRVGNPVKVPYLTAKFASDDGVIDIIAATKNRTGLRFGLCVGRGSRITIGSNVGSASKAFVRASEGASVTIGNDCMIASDIEIRTDDTHAIYDVESGLRTNMARDITIGDHVWIGKYAAVFGGVTIGSGSVIGFRSVVTRDIPNNAIAAGTPARVVRKNIAWERPTLDKNARGTKTLPKGQHKSEDFWEMTDDPSPVVMPAPKQGAPNPAPGTPKPAKTPIMRRVKRKIKRVLKRLLGR